MVTSIQNRKGWSAADRQPCFYPLMDPSAARHPQVSGCSAERHRFWLDGLGHVLKGDACESTEDGCGRASAKGLRGYCCEQVRWRGGRHLHGAAVTAAAELGRPWLVPSNHDDRSSISSLERRDANTAAPRPRTSCRKPIPACGRRAFRVHLGRPILSSPAASVEQTPTTIHIARRHRRRWPG
jgi:hypothetical protein